MKMGPKKMDKEKNQHIQVAIRCRPLNSTEKKQGSYNVVDINSERREVHIKERPLPTAPAKTFTFDRVFGPQAKQIELYKTTVVPIIEEVLLGYNCTIFAYGQTGTGKTFTMEGERSEDTSISWENDPLCGIIPRAMHQVFARLDKMNCEYTVRVSFLEIYNEELIDLLGAESVDNPRLKIYEDVTKKGTHVIQGLEDVVIHNKDGVYAVLERGTQRRQTAATLMNAHSSRSHSVFMVTIHMKENSIDGEELLKTGKLNLVDLAGSECIGRSGAVDKRAREAGNINQSLLTLGRVITALVEHAPHVPYRESKLTRLLQDSLGGRTKTSIIATISPASCNIEETLSTLDYAHRAKNITNRPEINQKLTKKALLKEYTEEMERLRKDLQAARDKNGIFIAEENYNSMQTQILQQKDNIKDLEEKMEVLNSEMYKLNELFTDTKQELEETSKELQVTSKNLTETTDNLHKTQNNLRHTRQDAEEQRHLVMQHVKTETKLYGQASQLMYTADEATQDVSGLHAKLDRKHALETHNENIQETFRVQFRENVNAMETGLKNFTEERTKTISTLDNELGNLLSKRAEEVKSMSQDLQGVRTMVTDQLTSLHQSQAQHSSQAQQWTEDVVAHCEQSRDSEICRQFEFHEHTFLATMASIRSMLTQISQDLHQVQQSMEKQKEEQQESVQSFVDKLVSGLSHQRELVSDYSNKMADRLENHRKQGQDIMKSQQESNKGSACEFMAGMENLMANFLKSQEVHLQRNVNHMLDDLAESGKQTADLRESVQSHIKEVSSITKDNNNQVQEQLTENYHTSSHNVQEIRDAVDKVNMDGSSLQENGTAFYKTGREVCTTSANHMIETMNNHLTEVTSQLSQHSTDTEALSSCCSASLSGLDSKQIEQHNQLEASIQSLQTTLEQETKAVTDWSEAHHAEMETQDKDVENFLTDQIKKYTATGTTPQRHEFSYPKNLAKTSRHSLILNEFRQTYLLEEAMNLPIPDDSQLHEQSQSDGSSQFKIPKYSLEEADNEGSNGTAITDGTENDPLNMSGDSAFSTNSSCLSDTDKILRSESKENLLRAPNNHGRVRGSKKMAPKSTPGRTTPMKANKTNVSAQGSTKPSSRLPLKANNP